ncbi:hypothetical protein CH381_12480 [Leptospira sp. mixed culture ATI2-C-A1]|nr:hypothetical protein CH381_12480 [Leptospira sp. mixed culture ATI2-C-A1]
MQNHELPSKFFLSKVRLARRNYNFVIKGMHWEAGLVPHPQSGGDTYIQSVPTPLLIPLDQKHLA